MKQLISKASYDINEHLNGNKQLFVARTKEEEDNATSAAKEAGKRFFFRATRKGSPHIVLAFFSSKKARQNFERIVSQAKETDPGMDASLGKFIEVVDGL